MLLKSLTGVGSKRLCSNTYLYLQFGSIETFRFVLPFSEMIQGLFIFFFHCVFNKEVRKHLKNTLTGKKPLPDDSTATRATLLTVRRKNGKRTSFMLVEVTKNALAGGLSITK